MISNARSLPPPLRSFPRARTRGSRLIPVSPLPFRLRPVKYAHDLSRAWTGPQLQTAYKTFAIPESSPSSRELEPFGTTVPSPLGNSILFLSETESTRCLFLSRAPNLKEVRMQIDAWAGLFEFVHAFVCSLDPALFPRRFTRRSQRCSSRLGNIQRLAQLWRLSKK